MAAAIGPGTPRKPRLMLMRPNTTARRARKILLMEIVGRGIGSCACAAVEESRRRDIVARCRLAYVFGGLRDAIDGATLCREIRRQLLVVGRPQAENAEQRHRPPLDDQIAGIEDLCRSPDLHHWDFH